MKLKILNNKNTLHSFDLLILPKYLRKYSEFVHFLGLIPPSENINNFPFSLILIFPSSTELSDSIRIYF